MISQMHSFQTFVLIMFALMDVPLNIRVCECVCVCVCVFIYFHRKTINVLPGFRSPVVCCGNISVSVTFVSSSMAIIEKAIKLATVQKSIKPGKATRSKRQPL